MVAGAPRTHDRDAIAKELIEWAKKPDSINLNKFCCTREPPLSPSVVIRWTKECDKFRQSYETAKAFLGARREEWLNSETLHVKAYDLNAANYDLFLKEERKEQAAYESSLKKDEEGAKQSTYNIMVPNDLAIGSNIPASPVSNKSNKST